MKLIFLLIFFFAPAFGQFLDLPAPSLDPTPAGDYLGGGAGKRSFIYVVPNEIHPEESKPIVSKAKEGVYVSVGADRGFIGAAQTKNASHLLLIDLSPEVVFFNQVNVTLLKASKNLEHYMQLRAGANKDAWRKAAENPLLTAKEKAILLDPSIQEKFSRFQQPATERLLQPEWFRGSSYLRDAELFGRLQKMAKEGKIQVAQGNLNDGAFLRSIDAALVEKKLPVSVLDVSNAWDHKYTGSKGVHNIVRGFDQSMKEDSILLVSHARQKLDDHIYHWDMYGYTRGALEEVEKRVGSPSAMYSLVKGEKFRARSSLLDRPQVNGNVVSTTRWMNLMKDFPDFAGSFVRKMVSVRNCVWGSPNCPLPKPPLPALSSLPNTDKMRLIVWEPEGFDFSFVIPQNKGETAEQALERYLLALEKNPEMANFALPFREARIGKFSMYPTNSVEPIAVAMATTRGRYMDDLAPVPPRMHRMLDPLTQRGARAFILPVGVTLGLDAKQGEEFRNLLATQVDILAAPGGADIHPKFYGQSNRFSVGMNPALDEDQLGTIREFLDDKESGFFLGVCRGMQMGAVASGCELIQDIKEEVAGSTQHTPRWRILGAKHEVKKTGVEEGSLSDRIFRGDGGTFTNESRHHQSVIPDAAGRVRVTGVSPSDGVVEFVEFRTPDGVAKGLGGQFHFERAPKEDISKRIFQIAYEEGQRARDRRLERMGIRTGIGLGAASRCAQDFSRIKTSW